MARAAQAIPFHLSDHPVNPNASLEARELLGRLHGWFGKKIVSGQQDEADERIPFLSRYSGNKLPAIRGFDLLRYSPSYNQPDGQIERALAWAAEQRGIVTFSWHWFSPFGAKAEVWRSFYTRKTKFNVAKVMDENSAEHRAVLSDLDGMAEHLKILRDARVPVLWRPLHEAEGKWFWWGAAGPRATKALYRLMYERFTKVHRLDNLIWIWTTSAKLGALEWYPGDDVVDILGADIYSSWGRRCGYVSSFNAIRELYGGRKAIALCETGALPDPDALAKLDAWWLWFLVWDDFITRRKLNPAKRIHATYQSERVITLRHVEML